MKRGRENNVICLRTYSFFSRNVTSYTTLIYQGIISDAHYLPEKLPLLFKKKKKTREEKKFSLTDRQQHETRARQPYRSFTAKEKIQLTFGGCICICVLK